ncbi:hypothetical protein [Thalassotalea marina]|uniref:Uncharacterized protein n=1 Tax=Thalassotalea marina TaxID=1673741 RepID=A0A919BME5_9GAMM|nr:hypothetical protein [Thalassotalea marina]GHF98689.1 hypothetical protein GCM10017161_29040 [Thalassotalea marina]
MWSLIVLIFAIIYFAIIVNLSYRLGQQKTENAQQAAVIGFVLAFVPPIALIYLAVLFFKDDTAIV